jgi:hypothetical protein
MYILQAKGQMPIGQKVPLCEEVSI